MQTVYFKAFDETGGKRSGTVQAVDVRAAAQELRRNGLRPYFVHDYQELKARKRQLKRRRRILYVGGGIVIACSLVLSGLVVGYVGRERPQSIENYKKAGLVQGADNLVYAKSSEAREFGRGIHEIWQSFTNEAVTGLEVNKYLLTIYVNRQIYKVPPRDFEALAEQTVRAFQRHFNSNGCKLLVANKDETLLEVSYNGFTKAMNLKSYR